ncbi:hypothetical protein [Natronobacterium gregoryi]|uniref:Uncharacterized protein n=2 Tax=Natronobacterium gregoryi TaxID=44930 RepID=L0AC69_NATGS|nr:hypothetical protein [Natronobacterium gregoryi]AFZ71498.1 hypothetical protein Natgr_0238 [Natronobacterium gregoryi SP2]ELY66801.1 hypothetical protein C490_12330 [Natronobacterium gregoryi SP2]PLK18703.1 hypothetical protein CYV19_17465 [Natronobacterium gregoryi SP2]SFJ67997.1 hypothetical protein SAMN05443661_1574 [Natronobacterium gregoryi]
MWPVNLYLASVASESVATAAVVGDALELFAGIDPLVRTGTALSGALLVSVIALGILQEHGPRSVTKARRSPIISVCLGLPGTFVAGGLTSAGLVMTGNSIGVFFGVPLVVLGALVLPTLTAFGLVAIGASIAARFGQDRLGAGVVVGSLLAGLASLSVAAAVILVTVAASLGVGAALRVLVGTRSTTRPDERTVPPANEI